MLQATFLLVSSEKQRECSRVDGFSHIQGAQEHFAHAFKLNSPEKRHRDLINGASHYTLAALSFLGRLCTDISTYCAHTSIGGRRSL